MPLALLTKDSIQDLTLLAREDADDDCIVHDNTTSGCNSESATAPPSSSPLNTMPGHPNSITAAATAAPVSPTAFVAATATTKPDASSLYYKGFSTEYHHATHNNNNNNNRTALLWLSSNSSSSSRQSNNNENPWVCCLFPWSAPPQLESDDEEEEEKDAEAPMSSNPVHQQPKPAVVEAASPTSTVGANQEDEEDDIQSSNSDALGEKLSEKERQAVLARLGLAPPEVSESCCEHDDDDNKHCAAPLQAVTQETDRIRMVDDSENNYDCTNNDRLTACSDPLRLPPPLKGILKQPSTIDLQRAAATVSTPQKNEKSTRRSLFPAYGPRSTATTGNKMRGVQFAPLARVVAVKSKNDMDVAEKSSVWWQKTDYEAFRKTGRIITKAIMEGGSEIWLSKASVVREKNNNATIGDARTSKAGDKWWHQFGHSRRGLEHVVSVEEGRDRQYNVRNAIRTVLQEQTRQRTFRREDAEKLRMVAVHHTAWARDLALAAGASDADAVSSQFAEDRKSREFYLLKMARGTPTSSQKLTRMAPNFMQPQRHFVRPVTAVPSSGTKLLQQVRLDAHTASQISFRRRQQTMQSCSSSTSSSSSTATKTMTEPIHDPDPSSGDLAARAAGFSSVDGEKVNMAAVLTGMGASTAAVS